MSAILFNSADERLAFLRKTNPRGVILAGFPEWFKSVHGHESQFTVGQSVVILYKGDEWVDIMSVSRDLAVMTKPEYVEIYESDKSKPVWG